MASGQRCRGCLGTGAGLGTTESPIDKEAAAVLAFKCETTAVIFCPAPLRSVGALAVTTAASLCLRASAVTCRVRSRKAVISAVGGAGVSWSRCCTAVRACRSRSRRALRCARARERVSSEAVSSCGGGVDDFVSGGRGGAEVAAVGDCSSIMVLLLVAAAAGPEGSCAAGAPRSLPSGSVSGSSAGGLLRVSGRRRFLCGMCGILWSEVGG